MSKKTLKNQNIQINIKINTSETSLENNKKTDNFSEKEKGKH